MIKYRLDKLSPSTPIFSTIGLLFLKLSFMLLFSSETISGSVTPVTQPSPRPSRGSIHIAVDNLVIVDYKVMPHCSPQECPRRRYCTDCWLHLLVTIQTGLPSASFRARLIDMTEIQTASHKHLFNHTTCIYRDCFLTKRRIISHLVQAVHPRHLTRQ